MRKCVVLIALLCPFAAPFVNESAACSCGERSPCQIFNGAGAVFLGDVIDVQQGATEVVARMQVRHVWKGQVGQVVSVRSGSSGSSCGVHFEVGQRRLVFAGGSADSFSTGACSGGGVLSANTPLPNLPPVPGRLSGRVADMPIERIARSREDRSDPTLPVTSGRIWFDTPSGRRETTIDSNGRFQFDNVDPGEGTLQADVGPAHEARSTNFRIRNVTDCEDVFVPARSAGRLAGSVVGPDGKGVAGVHLNLRPHIEPKVSYPVGTHTETDASGRFEFRGLGGGKYVLGVNLDVPPGVSTPYSTLYYPGVSDRASANVLSIGAGGAPELESPFVLPPALPTRTLTVSVKCRDGSVPPILSVEAVASDRSSRVEHEFSRDPGTVAIRLLRDVAYDITIQASFPRPDHDTFLQPKVLERLHVEAGADMMPVNVLAPFAACARRER